MPSLQIFDVKPLGLAGGFEASGLDGLVDVLELVPVEDWLFKAEDVVCASAAVGDIGRHVGFKSAVPDEHHHGFYGIRG